MLKLGRITNLFTGEMHEWQAHPGQLLPAYYPDGFNSVNGIVEVNSKRIDEPDLYLPNDEDKIIFADRPGAFLGTFLVLVAVGAIRIFPALPFLPDFKKERRGFAEFFDGPATTVGSNVRVPVIAGRVRTGGHIIESFLRPKLNADGTFFDVVLIKGKKNKSTLFSGREQLYTRVVWGWGPIESISDLEIDENPIEIVTGLSYQTKLGFDDDGTLFGFSESNPNVRTDEDLGAPARGTILQSTDPKFVRTSTPVQAIEIALKFPQGLFKISSKGKVRNAEVDVLIEYKEASQPDGDYIVFDPDNLGFLTISNRTRSQNRYWIRLPPLSPAIYDVRISRITEDKTQNLKFVDEFELEILQEIVVGTRAHPGLAETGFRQIPQEQANAPRNFTAIIAGINDVRIYSNTTTYSTSWTNNPAWLFMRLVTDEFFSFGKFFNYGTSFNIQEFINLANYCNQSVDDATGAKKNEKRCTFNHVFKDSVSLEEFVEIFNLASDATIYLEGSIWRVVLNDDKVEELILTAGSYQEDSLEWHFDNLQERSTRLQSSFVNERNEYRNDSIVAVDSEATEFARHITTHIDLPGVTRPSQAARTLVKIVNFNRISDEHVSFKAGLTAFDLRIGSVFRIESETSGTVLASGRILEINAGYDRLRIDSDLKLDMDNIYKISVQHVDRTVDTFTLQNITETPTDWVYVLAENWSKVPMVGDEYFVVESTVEKNLFKVEDITLEEDLSRSITATKWNNTINDTTGIQIDVVPTFLPPSPDIIPPAVTNLKVGEPTDGSGLGQGLNVSWDCPPGLVAEHEIWIRESGEKNWIFITKTLECSRDISVEELEPSTAYELTVRSVSQQFKSLSLDDTTIISFTTVA